MISEYYEPHGPPERIVGNGVENYLEPTKRNTLLIVMQCVHMLPPTPNKDFRNNSVSVSSVVLKVKKITGLEKPKHLTVVM